MNRIASLIVSTTVVVSLAITANAQNSADRPGQYPEPPAPAQQYRLKANSFGGAIGDIAASSILGTGDGPIFAVGRLDAAGVSPNARAPRSASRSPRTLQTDQAPMGRQGFIVGIGGGAGIQRFYNPFLFVPAWENKTSAITDLKIGYAPHDQWLLYYTNQVAWGETPPFDAVGMSAFGVSYMLETDSPSAYVTGSVGASVGLDLGSGSGDTGLGMSAGGGYEFMRHFSVGGEWMSLDVGAPDRTNVFAVTFDWLYY